MLSPAPTSNQPAHKTFQRHVPHNSTQALQVSIEAVASSPSQPDDGLNTQSSNVHDMRHLLQDMMLPERISQGDTQTQGAAQVPRLPAPNKVSAVSGGTTISPSKLLISKPTVSDMVVLLPMKVKELQRDKHKLYRHARELAKKSGLRVRKGQDIVLCQCGHSGEEGDMTECTYCATWQHLHCYGYTGASDPKLPDDHTCYQCLLGDDQQGCLTKMQALALRRRGMHIALRTGLGNMDDFASDLGASILTPLTYRTYMMDLTTCWYQVHMLTCLCHRSRSHNCESFVPGP